MIGITSWINNGSSCLINNLTDYNSYSQMDKYHFKNAQHLRIVFFATLILTEKYFNCLSLGLPIKSLVFATSSLFISKM
jgi:hypothetical protein